MYMDINSQCNQRIFFFPGFHFQNMFCWKVWHLLHVLDTNEYLNCINILSPQITLKFTNSTGRTRLTSHGLGTSPVHMSSDVVVMVVYCISNNRKCVKEFKERFCIILVIYLIFLFKEVIRNKLSHVLFVRFSQTGSRERKNKSMSANRKYIGGSCNFQISNS